MTKRSPNTDAILAILTQEPQTIAAIAVQVGVRPMNVSAHLRTLLKSGECRELSVDNGHGKVVRAFALPRKSVAQKTGERGEYIPGPGPLRYEPRDVRAVGLSGYGWVEEK